MDSQLSRATQDMLSLMTEFFPGYTLRSKFLSPGFTSFHASICSQLSMDSLDISIRQLQDTFVSPLMSLGAAQTSSEWVWLNPAGFRNTIKLGKCKTENVSLFRFPL